MATASARDRQPIADLPASVDDSQPLVALLDAVLAQHQALAELVRAVPSARTRVGELIYLRGDEDVERVIRLWTSARGFRLVETIHDYEPDRIWPHGHTIRSLRVYTGPKNDAELVVAAWMPVAKLPATGAAVREALRTWRPSDGDLDAAAPHWSDDKTLTEDERASREQMEAGHA